MKGIKCFSWLERCSILGRSDLDWSHVEKESGKQAHDSEQERQLEVGEEACGYAWEVVVVDGKDNDAYSRDCEEC